MEDVSVRSWLQYGWDTFKSRPWIFVGATALLMLLYGVTGSISSGLDALFSGSAEEPSLPGALFSWLAGTLISMGATAFYLTGHDNPQAVNISQLWHPQPFWYYLGTSILVSIAVFLGLLLLIVPGVIVALMLMFATVIVIDRGLSPMAAIKESRRITTGYKWKLFSLVLVLMLVNLIGILALVVGLLVTVPVTVLAAMNAYRVLALRAGELAPVPARLPDASI